MLDTYRYSAGKFPVSFVVLKLTGSDVESFLQKQSTYNFSELLENSFHLMSFLDPQGRVEFYCWCLRGTSDVLLLIPKLLKPIALERLNRFLISEDVEITDQGLSLWNFYLGPEIKKHQMASGFKGLLFEEETLLCESSLESVPTISPAEVDLWRSLNGWPDFEGKEFRAEIINNLRLYDLSVSPNKGCYPGQETVSKIATRRGAAYSPVLLETSFALEAGAVLSFDKKVGDVISSHSWNGRFYSCASLLRDFRVSGMRVNFLQNTREFEATVRYYPLLSASAEEKAKDLFYEATEAFKKDDFAEAERLLRKSIELDPKFGDAYESLGVMLGRLNRFPEAIELMDQLTSVDPSSVLAHTNKSLFLMKLGKIDEAEEQKSLATIKSFQKFGDEAKLKERMMLEKKAQEEEWSKRENMFRQVLEIDEEDTLANYGIGSIAVERQQWHLAITHLEKVLKADPNYSVAYLSLGKAYKGSGQKDNAADIWKKGVIVAAKKGDLMPANQMQFELQNL